MIVEFIFLSNESPHCEAHAHHNLSTKEDSLQMTLWVTLAREATMSMMSLRREQLMTKQGM